MFEINQEIQEPQCLDPRRLLIFSHVKVGKTSLGSQLPNSFLIDIEDGSEFIPGRKINVKRELANVNLKRSLEGKPNLDLYQAYKATLYNLKKENEKKGDFLYDYIIIDTISSLEDIAAEYAAFLYRKTDLGKGWQGDDISTLPKGAGWGWIRTAFLTLYDELDSLARKGVILLGHVKNSSIQKNGEEVSARDIDLSGKLSRIVAAHSDAIGYLYRKEETNENYISFKTVERDLATGARPDHLTGKEFLISKYEDGKLQTYWNNIFQQVN